MGFHVKIKLLNMFISFFIPQNGTYIKNTPHIMIFIEAYVAYVGGCLLWAFCPVLLQLMILMKIGIKTALTNEKWRDLQKDCRHSKVQHMTNQISWPHANFYESEETTCKHTGKRATLFFLPVFMVFIFWYFPFSCRVS